MIAAKAFDPVVGVDIHMIQPPGPVPPVPIPHPFVGMLVDPMDFAPVIGATVMVNGMPRATAGTGGKCIPPHIPIGGVFVKPPGNECEVFMGSATVLADGDPLSSLGMPALSCHDIGMPSPPRLKKKTKPKSLELPTSVVLAVPMGAPVLVGGPPTISMMALGMKAGMAGLGKAFKKLKKLQKASKKWKKISKKAHDAAEKAMKKLGIPPSIQNKVHRGICTVTGHPVDVATGKMYTEAVDFELAGPIPIAWERVWYSCSSYTGPLGHGWHHSYDVALLEEEGVAVVRLVDGRPLVFPALGPGESSSNELEGLSLLRDTSGYALRDQQGRTFRFAQLAQGVPQPLAGVEGGAHDEIRFQHDAHGRITSFADATGNAVTLEYDERGRVTAIRAPRPDQPEVDHVVVRYEYDGAGDLIAARDALGQPFCYTYENHLLVQETDRRGYSFFFRYDASVTNARCVSTWGQDGLYSVSLVYQPGQTTTTFDDGGTWIYKHDGSGLVQEVIDPYGGRLQFRHDEKGRVISEVDPGGSESRYEYAESGAPTRRINAVGHPVVLPPDDENDDELPDPNSYELETTAFAWEHGATAQPVAGTDPAHSADWPAAIQDSVRAARKPVSATEEPAEQIDSKSRVVQRRYRDGSSESWVYDAEGNVVACTDRDGSTTRYTYGSRNMVVVEADPLGHESRYEYSRSQELTRAIDPLGNDNAFAHDLKDRNTEIRIGADVLETLEYDAADNLLQTRDALGRRITTFRIGPGNVEAARLAGERELHSFAYDATGRVIEATTSQLVTRLAYAENGALVADLRDGAGVQHQVDDHGRAVKSTYFAQFDVGYGRSDDQPGVTIITDPTGAQHSIRVGWNGEVQKRLASGCVELARYDAEGKCVDKYRWRAHGPQLHQRYSYSPAGNLLRINDSRAGESRFEYDAAHRLRRAFRPGGAVSNYAFDPAGNLLEQPELAGVGFGAANRIVEANGDTFTYDLRGRVIQRAGRSGSYRYEYDAHDQLTRADVAGVPWEASYDALGRRVSTTWRGQTTGYWWDDFRLAAEQKPDGALRLYLYPHVQSLVPFMFVEYESTRAPPESGRRFYVFANHVGVPICVEDDIGIVVWAADITPFGRAHVTSAGGVAMPLRFPGHYFDAETGLHYNRFRYYSPELGRYLQPDPLGYEDSINLYAYSPNPLIEVDIDGLAYKSRKAKAKKPKAKTKKPPKAKAKAKPKAKKPPKKPKTKKDANGRLHNTDGTFAKGPRKKGQRHSRSTEYPHGNDPKTRQAVIDKNTKNGKVRDPDTGKVIPDDKVTIEHKQKVVDHWNEKGHNQSYEDRKKWYNDEDNLTVKEKSANSAEGATCGETYTQKTGPDYSN